MSAIDSITEGERALIVAVRNTLRLPIVDGGAGYSDAQCDIEPDEMAPATVGEVYVVVMCGGYQPGPRHRSSGGINDTVYGIDITVIKRIAQVPRDRHGSAYINNLSALSPEIGKVYNALDWNYDLITAANVLITANTGSVEGFMEPLKFSGIEKRPRIVGGDVLGSDAKSKAVGLARMISFHGARRMTHKA